MNVNHLGIDVRTKDKNKLVARLRSLVSTVSVEDGGLYHEDLTYSQVWVTTHKSMKELDDWLYTLKGIEYIGTWERETNEHES